MTSPPQLNVVANVAAGYWKSHPRAVRELLATAGDGARIFLTESLDELRRLFTDRLVASPGDNGQIDVIAGGDGTVCQFLSCRRHSGRDDVPVLLIPTGTMNAIAEDLGLTRSEAHRILRAIRSGRDWRSASRPTIDVAVNDARYTGFVFETGFASHILREFYRGRNSKGAAAKSLVKAISILLRVGSSPMSIESDRGGVGAQSVFVSCIGRMVFGLRPFGRSPELPVFAQFRLTEKQQRRSWWRLVVGNVSLLVEQRNLILEPFLDHDRLTIRTLEPANLDGEMIANGEGRDPAELKITRGGTVRLICTTI